MVYTQISQPLMVIATVIPKTRNVQSEVSLSDVKAQNDLYGKKLFSLSEKLTDTDLWDLKTIVL